MGRLCFTAWSSCQSLFYQHVTDKIFSILIKKAFELHPPAELEEKVALSFEEENVVQYVGGYILYSLMKDKKNSGIFPLLEKLCSDDEMSQSMGERMLILTSVDKFCGSRRSHTHYR